MTDKVRVEVAGIRSTATELDGVASALDTVKTALEAAVTAGKDSWGDDEYGHGFTNGDGGYLKREPQLLEAVGSIADRLRVYSDGVTKIGDAFEQNEKTNADGFPTT